MVCYTDGSKLETTGSTGPYHRQRSATALPVKVQSLQHMKRRTRNSAVADKPRDEFVQMQWRGWPPKTRSSPYVLQCRILSICVKRYRHKYRWTPNIGQRWNSALLRCDAELTARYTPLPACITTSNLSSASKGVRMNRRETPNWYALGPRHLSVGIWLTPRNTSLPKHVLSCRIWSF